MENRLYTGKDKAAENGFDSYKAWILSKIQAPWNGKMSKEHVTAYIDFSRTLADCPCGNTLYVEPTEDFFYCRVCSNKAHKGSALHVKFPTNLAELEKELMLRPVRIPIVSSEPDSQQAMTAVPVYPMLARSWQPEESIEDLRAQRVLIEGMRSA